ncbi:MAG: hypothetical protein DCC59_15235 [Chloroflexi bacterium]|nr:hypothetical protein [Anaerolineales bacterium]RIK48476.1 MAG: hypothetical protein DCC59_15235 [Chloroflexota bacterium]
MSTLPLKPPPSAVEGNPAPRTALGAGYLTCFARRSPVMDGKTSSGGKIKRLVLLAGLTLALTGCAPQTPTPPPTPVIEPTTIPSPPPVMPAPTPVELPVDVTAELVNCRFGPGVVYLSLNEIRQGRTLVAVGRDESFSWWLVEDPINPGGFCWVSAEVTDEKGDVSQLPVAPAPTVTVTKLALRVEPNRIFVDCDQFPQTVFFEAEITANGPTLVAWQWEASTGVVSDVGALVYEESGTQVINEFYRINAPNEYWVKLKILSPNELTEQVAFPVSCAP